MVQKKTGLGLRQDRIFQVKPDLDKSDIDSVVNYLNSGGWLTEHKITESFEKEIKDYVDRKSAFSVPNGTIAIYLSILASGIKKGSRVAVPNLTMIATINAVLWAESIPVLVDVDETLCMSYEKLTEVNDLDAVIANRLEDLHAKEKNRAHLILKNGEHFALSTNKEISNAICKLIENN